MRAKLLMTASAIAIATPAMAADLSGYVPPSGDPIYSPAPMVVGHLSVGVGIGDIDETDDNVGIFTGVGRANIPFSGGVWNLELETGGGALWQGGDS